MSKLKKIALAVALTGFSVQIVHAGSNPIDSGVMKSLEKPSTTTSGGKVVNDFGSFQLKFDYDTIDLTDFVAPKWSAGCNGIMLQGGSLSILKDANQFVSKIKQMIKSDVTAYAFKQAMSAICSGCEAVMSSLEAFDRALNSGFKDRCTVYNALDGKGTQAFSQYAQTVEQAFGDVKTAAYGVKSGFLGDSAAAENDEEASEKITDENTVLLIKNQGSNVATYALSKDICSNFSLSTGISKNDCAGHLASLIGYQTYSADASAKSDDEKKITFTADPSSLGQHVALISGKKKLDEQAGKINIPTCQNLKKNGEDVVDEGRNIMECRSNAMKALAYTDFADTTEGRINDWLKLEAVGAKNIGATRDAYMRLIPPVYRPCIEKNTIKRGEGLNDSAAGLAVIMKNVILEHGDKFVAESYRIALESTQKAVSTSKEVPFNPEQQKNYVLAMDQLKPLMFDSTTLSKVWVDIIPKLHGLYGDPDKCVLQK